jgi:ribosomal protein L11 methyltransferase
MKHPILWKTSVTTTTEAEDAVAELLATHVAPHPSAYTDAESGVTTVSAYSTTPPKNAAATRRALRAGLKTIQTCGLSPGPGKITIQKLPRKNWAESWKRHFKPLEIGTRLLVIPSWLRRQPRRGQAVIVLDPGLSFGTGRHPTTEFCLRELVRAARGRSPSAAHGSERRLKQIQPAATSGCAAAGDRPRSFLDIGTGSGILAIAAAKLSYAPVHAFDYDPQSIIVARANARTNHATRQIKLTRTDLTKLPRRAIRRYDVVCANLLANLLIAERDRLLARVAPDGMLVVAGILKREFDEVATAYYAAGMKLVASRAKNEWRSGTFMRSPMAPLF